MYYLLFEISCELFSWKLQVIIEVDLLEDVDGFGPLLGPDQLDVEVEGRAARNDVAGTLVAVTELCKIKFIKV